MRCNNQQHIRNVHNELLVGIAVSVLQRSELRGCVAGDTCIGAVHARGTGLEALEDGPTPLFIETPHLQGVIDIFEEEMRRLVSKIRQ